MHNYQHIIEHYGNQLAENKIIMCHGFGADEQDLIDIARYIDNDGQYHWLFPRAPYSLPACPGFAWFPEDPSDQLQALKGNYFSTISHIQDPGLIASIDLIFKIYLDLKTQIKAPKVILAGFSQGSMIALHTAIKHLTTFSGLVLMSSALVDSNSLLALIDPSNLHSLPCLQSHGIYDPILSYAQGQEVTRLLGKLGINPELVSFEGGHEIPLLVLHRLASFIDETFNNAHSE